MRGSKKQGDKNLMAKMGIYSRSCLAFLRNFLLSPRIDGLAHVNRRLMPLADGPPILIQDDDIDLTYVPFHDKGCQTNGFHHT